MGLLHMQHIQPPTFPIILNFCNETNQDFWFFSYPCHTLRETFYFYGKLSHKTQIWNPGTDTLQVATIPSGSIVLVTSHPRSFGQCHILHQTIPHLENAAGLQDVCALLESDINFIFVSPVKCVNLRGSASTHLLK